MRVTPPPTPMIPSSFEKTTRTQEQKEGAEYDTYCLNEYEFAHRVIVGEDTPRSMGLHTGVASQPLTTGSTPNLHTGESISSQTKTSLKNRIRTWSPLFCAGFSFALRRDSSTRFNWLYIGPVSSRKYGCYILAVRSLEVAVFVASGSDHIGCSRLEFRLFFRAIYLFARYQVLFFAVRFFEGTRPPIICGLPPMTSQPSCREPGLREHNATRPCAMSV
jgi:hypothetical protein